MQLLNEAKQKLSMSAAWGRLALLLTMLSLGVQSAWALGNQGNQQNNQQGNNDDQKISNDLKTGKLAQSNSPVDVIIQFKRRPNQLDDEFLRALGGKTKRRLTGINAVALRISPQMFAFLKAHPEIAYVSPDRHLSRMVDAVAPSVLADVAFKQYGFDGSGVGVAVIDSGISDHPDLYSSVDPTHSRVVYSESFVAGDVSTNDGYGHGTHVAGIIGGNGAASASGYSRQYTGIAPGVSLINLRVLDANGGGSDSAVIAAIQRAIALKNIYNIRVLNLSLGRPVQESYTLDPLCQAVEAAWNAGIAVVVAAGNNGRSNFATTQGYGTINSPANDPSVITVGAVKGMGTDTRIDDSIASFSSKGPSQVDHIAKPDLVAPGNTIVSLLAPGSTLATNYPSLSVAPNPVQTCDVLNVCTTTTGQPQYFALSGTSMATPVVSGAVALLVQQNPALTPDQIKARLMKTAWKSLPQFSTAKDTLGNLYNEESDIFTVGAGYLDVQAALSSGDLAQGLALSPTAKQDPITGAVALVNTTPSASGASVAWAVSASDPNAAIWGTSTVYGSQAVDATSTVWGTSVIFSPAGANPAGVTATSVVWGVDASSVVWGVDASSIVWGLDASSVVWGIDGSGGDVDISLTF